MAIPPAWPARACPLTAAERRFLDAAGAPVADLYQERVLRLERSGRSRSRLELEGACSRRLWPREREELEVRSPGAEALAPFSGAELDQAEAELDQAAGPWSLRIERRLRIATREGAWERRELWTDQRAAAPPDRRSPVPAGSWQGPLLLEPQAAAVLFHELIGHGLETGPAGGLPVLAEGATIGPAALAIEDRPWFDRDDEGVAAVVLALVVAGRVEARLADRRSGRSSGRARRASYRDAPLARLTRLCIAPGPTPEAELRAAAGARLSRVARGAASDDGAHARLHAPRIEIGGQVLGPARVTIALASLATARLGRQLGQDPAARCDRDGHEVWVAAESPSVLILAEVEPA